MADLTYLVLTRFPLLLAAVLVGYAGLAQFLLPRFLQSSLVVDLYGIRHVAFVASLAALTVMLTRHIVLLYGPARFGMAQRPRPHRLTVRHTLGHVALVLPLLTALVVNSRGERSTAALSVWAATGIASALVCFWIVIGLQYVLVRPQHRTADRLLPLVALRSALEGRDLVPASLRQRASTLSSSLGSRLGPGFVGSDGALLPYHGLALSMLAASSIGYAIYYFRGMPGTELGASIPAIAYLLVLATAWTWLLAGAAFVLDRYRFPIVVLTLAWSAGVSAFARSDHYFQHSEAPRISFPTPAAIARTNDDLPLIVAAADGGGIQAATWTALALTETERAWPDFGQSLRLISSVSGGSVGSMYFVNALDRDRPPTPAVLDEVVRLAARGAINESWWGWAYPDFWRALLPLPPSQRFIKDRAWALERSWALDWTGADARLSDWALAASVGRKPAIAFNTTTVEGGRRFLIASFQVPESWQVGSFAQTYAGRDLDVVTAARLSATFPFTTPVSRAWPDSETRIAQHIADGGYYDNTGMLTALQWLDEVLRAAPERYQHRPVGVIRLASAPDFQGAALKDRSTWYQLVAPLVTQLAVLRAAQVERMRTELEHFTTYWCTQGIEIVPFTFQFRQGDPPLSWSLTPSQRHAIDDEWTSDANQATLRQLLQTMRRTSPPASSPAGNTAADPCPLRPAS